ncbi:MAG: hypothetical protein JJU28_19085 [Cyclobacteriaceae bacterium]|nr:hypothetical protein [Cyclobacteriaceae bacterium]
MSKKIWCSLWLLYILWPLAFSQTIENEEDTSYVAFDWDQFDSLFENEEDSLSIFKLVEALLEAEKPRSYLLSRLGYVSNIVNAGRTFGVNQFGFNAGAAFYHKSGFFMDASLFWNSDFEPSLGPFIASLGYMNNVNDWLTLLVSYDRFFYKETDIDSPDLDWLTRYLITQYPTLNNAVNANAMINHKYFFGGLDYTFLFGNDTAHRIMATLSANVKFRNVWIFDRIRIMPGFNMLFGNATVTSISFNENIFRRTRMLRPAIRIEQSNEFGLMNYGLTTPVSLTRGSYTLLLSYQLNQPVALPGETLPVETNSYMSISVLYNLPIKNSKASVINTDLE